MALNKERYSEIGKIRIYCDVIQYLKSIGLQHLFYRHWTDEYDTDTNVSHWDYNPSKIVPLEVTQQFNQQAPNAIFIADGIVVANEIGFNDDTDNASASIDDEIPDEIKKLLTTVNYFGVLGQDIYSQGGSEQFELETYGGTSISKASTTDVISGGDGTYLATIDGWDDTTIDNFQGFRVKSFFPDALNDITDRQIGIGTYTVGTYFDFEHSPDLSTSISVSFDGIKRQRTMGGKDLTHIKYLSSNWGNYVPFSTTYEEQNFTGTALQGRRIIDVNFTMLSESNTFPKNMHDSILFGNVYDSSGNQSDFDFNADSHNANFLSNYLNITLGGNISHIMQLDSTTDSEGNMAHDFVWVKLDGKATQITQKSPNLYSVKLKFIEQF